MNGKRHTAPVAPVVAGGGALTDTRRTLSVMASRMVAIVLLASVGAIPCSADALPPGMFDPASPLAGRVWEFENGGLRFRIPEGYLGPSSKAGKIEGNFRLEALWPGLEPRHAGNDAEFKAPGGGRKIAIEIDFFKDASRRARFLNRLRGDAEYRAGWRKTPESFEEMTPASDIYGLTRKVIDIEMLKKFIMANNPSRITNGEIDKFEISNWHDYYYKENENGDVVVLIKCSTDFSLDPDESLLNGRNIVPVPYCDHYFKDDGYNLNARLIYRRKFLKDWREIQDFTEAIISATATKNSDN
ncbi:hypothetical protein ABNQ39_14920 [Azospirillum sp. A26]|uniref:hypothetical protein n=1 Tax=Azospirillum sp. A26 TaxID=3160607 RepID=UPI003670DA88